jgi:plasmid stabilization system protein ParE
VVWTDRALDDLRAIGDFIARDNPAAAEKWVGSLLAAAASAAETPLAGRIVPEFKREDVRELLRRTYRIVYRVREQSLEILTVFEGHRRFPQGVLPDMAPPEE